MRTLGRINFFFLLCVAFPAWAQGSSNWRVFKNSDGLAESFVTSVNISQRSNVWVKHFEANSASFLDGYRSKNIPAPDRGAYRIHENRSGQIWTAHADGLQEYKNGVWMKYAVRDIRNEFQSNVVRHARSIPIVPLKQGYLLYLLPDRLVQFNNEWPPQSESTPLRQVSDTGLGRFTDMTLGRDGTLWVIGRNGLLRLTNGIRVTAESAWQEELLDPNLGIQDLQQAIADDTGGVTTVADSRDGRKVIAHFDGKGWSILSPGNYNIRQAWKTEDGTFWAISINALLRRQADGTFTEDKEVPAFQFFDVASQGNGVFWLATSEGLVRHSPSVWRAPIGMHPNFSTVRTVWEQGDGALWLATSEGLNLKAGDTWKHFRFPQELQEAFQPGEHNYFLSDSFITLAGSNLLSFSLSSKTFNVVEHPSGQAVHPLGLWPDGALAVQTRGKNAMKLEAFNGAHFGTSPVAQPPLSDEAQATAFIATSSGEIWLSSNEGMAHYVNGRWEMARSDDTLPGAVLCFAEVSNGRIWCGTRDAVWQYSGQTWELLRGRFDRVNAIAQGRDGNIWVASNSGLHRFWEDQWFEHSSQDGLPADSVTEVYEDRTGRLWAGTLRGAAIYAPQADLDPPRSFVTKLNTTEDDQVTIAFAGNDKWKYTPPEALLFSYRLNEREWSDFGKERSVTFQELPAGTHYFQVRAMDRNWNVDTHPALLDFEVLAPWYQETRLVLIALAGLGVTLFFAGLAFNRHRRLLRSYAEVEKIVQLRTQQLEQANAQLLHSQKMTALGALAAGVAHDFNSILSIIKGSAQIIETNLNDREKIKVRAQRISTAVEQGSEVVKAMLGFSGPSETSPVRCNVNELILQTIKLVGDRFQRDLRMVFIPDNKLPVVTGSPNLLQQILVNFIFNAADALEGKGKIEIRAEKIAALPASLILIPRVSEEYVVVSVCDNGCGIAPEMLPRIFEPFFTTKAFSSRRGTGLGLSMVYQMAKEMSCGLAVTSTVGGGSVFTLFIPAGAEQQRPLEESGTSHVNTSTAK